MSNPFTNIYFKIKFRIFWIKGSSLKSLIKEDILCKLIKAYEVYKHCPKVVLLCSFNKN